MDRREARDTDRKRTALAIGASIAIHAAALSAVTLDLPVFGADETSRPLRVVELPDRWRSAAMEVVPLESAVALEPVRASAGASAGAREAASPASSSGGAVALALPSAPRRPVATSRSLDLTMAAETAALPPEIASDRPARGILLRSGTGASAESSLHFYAASDAARDAEEDERGGTNPGRGIGISIDGPGHCPTGGGIPAIGMGGGLGGVPTTGKGMGIIGARPPNRGAINRAAPPIGGGR